ncbi:MAG: Rpn family recombination-promoting nuclease/putative transposase [Bacteroidales bacterium]|nr:Rpn family recombination-promoting nuclease/putative transposase [Bacteroidales bacterium]
MNKDILIGFLNEVIADKVIVGLEYLGLCSMCIADARTARAS